MAGRGFDGMDITLLAGARARTSTSLHLWVTADGPATTATAAFTPDIPNTLTGTRYPVGAIQTPNMSANVTDMNVRIAGVTAARAGASINAFSWLKISVLASLQGYAIACDESIVGATLGTTTQLTGVTSPVGVIGQALEPASTLQTFEMIIRPFVAGLSLS